MAATRESGRAGSKKAKKGGKKASKKPAVPFDKYWYYKRSVQGPETDVVFLRDVYKEIRKTSPLILREDFCGTFSICCEWVKLNAKFRAHGIDLDEEPIEYGLKHYAPELTAAQRERVTIHQDNVLSPGLPKADVIAAMNFSHFIFKDRKTMKEYFANCHKGLNPGGLLVADAFGGSRCYEANEESTKHRGFTYYWDQENHDPVTGFAQFHIHFKLDGQKKIEKAFSYDWRLWNLPELREMMEEVGFSKTHVYWEGTTRGGKGNGVFKATEKGEECQAWIAYVIGEK